MAYFYILLCATVVLADSNLLQRGLYDLPNRDNTGDAVRGGSVSGGNVNGAENGLLFLQQQQSGSNKIGQSGSQLFQPRHENHQVTNLPQYEDHVITVPTVAEPKTSTITNLVTKTHTLRVPSTSDVWVTEVKNVHVPVTVATTRHSYTAEPADTVTSFVRVTRTPVEVETRTDEILQTKTLVSVFTEFVTEISTVELWQPIVHVAKSYDIMTLPIVETQTLLQVLFTTVTVTSRVDVTSVRAL